MTMARLSAGFTVVEVLVAIALLGIILTATSSLFMATTMVGATSRTATDAAVVAQEEFEILRGLSFLTIPAGTDQPCLARTVIAGRTYTCARTVEINPVIDGAPEPNMKRITVTISWAAGGQSRTYVVRTIYADVEQ